MPFLPIRNPGVESPWIANSAVIVENAVPIRIARPSRARAPATLSDSDASEVSAAVPPTSPKCTLAGNDAAFVPINATNTTGATARTNTPAAKSLFRDITPGYRPPASRVERKWS